MRDRGVTAGDFSRNDLVLCAGSAVDLHADRIDDLPGDSVCVAHYGCYLDRFDDCDEPDDH